MPSASPPAYGQNKVASMRCLPGIPVGSHSHFREHTQGGGGRSRASIYSDGSDAVVGLSFYFIYFPLQLVSPLSVTHSRRLKERGGRSSCENHGNFGRTFMETIWQQLRSTGNISKGEDTVIPRKCLSCLE